MIYRLIGKVVVRLALETIQRRYGVQIRFALGFGLAALVIGAYLASREVPEG